MSGTIEDGSEPSRVSPGLPTTRDELADALYDARRHTLGLVADLDDEQMLGPRLDIVNPLLWEIGHVAWFQERWLRRHLRGRDSLLDEADVFYDSMAVPHDTRWDLKLVGRQHILDYMQRTLDDTLEHLSEQPSDEALPEGELDVHLLALFHEDMHAEAFCYTRQTLGYPPPDPSIFDADPVAAESKEVTADVCRDVTFKGGTFELGARDDEIFVFDNEQWAHEVEVAPFAMARTAVSQGEFADFVNDGGYEREELWSDEGRIWLHETGATRPAYWTHGGSGSHATWARRVYDRLVDLQPDLPMVHVGWYEADAYCRWAGRRLPTEAEWELAASLDTASLDIASGTKRRYPWGDEASATGRANLDGAFRHRQIGGTVPVGALSAGDTPSGLRQMFGNVWEWTSTDFGPYPGFRPGLYKDYSQPWFGDHKVLRGGCWATRSRMMRNTLRNFYKPDRRDVWAGFRTCAL